MPCATNGTTEVATEAAGTAAPEAAATAPAAAAPALEDTDAPAARAQVWISFGLLWTCLCTAFAQEEAAAFTQDAADADVSAEDEDASGPLQQLQEMPYMHSQRRAEPAAQNKEARKI